MSEDLISNSFGNNVNKGIIKRNIVLLKIVLILYLIYTLFTIVEWYFLVISANLLKQTALIFFHYKITPVIVAISLILGIFIWVFYLKAHKLILLSFEDDNADFFNEGYSFFNKATTLNIIGFSVIILSLITRFILKYLY
jgi:hypothetical protein